jgi:hypothetical protein
MLKAVNAALIAISLICPSKADAQEQPDPDAVAAATQLIMTMRITDGFALRTCASHAMPLYGKHLGRVARHRASP